MDKQLDIIEGLYPDFREYADNAQFFYWMDYACELDVIRNVVYDDDKDVVAYLNERMLKLSNVGAEHHAATDVASTLEESLPQFKGVFKYE